MRMLVFIERCIINNQLKSAVKKQKKTLTSRLAFLPLIYNLAVTYSHMGNPHTTIGMTTFHF